MNKMTIFDRLQDYEDEAKHLFSDDERNEICSVYSGECAAGVFVVFKFSRHIKKLRMYKYKLSDGTENIGYISNYNILICIATDQYTPATQFMLLSDEDIRSAIKGLYINGPFTQVDCAAFLNVSQSTVSNIAREIKEELSNA